MKVMSTKPESTEAIWPLVLLWDDVARYGHSILLYSFEFMPWTPEPARLVRLLRERGIIIVGIKP
jgi:hypothetical protein